jgi:hypothetical protein
MEEQIQMKMKVREGGYRAAIPGRVKGKGD